MKEAIFKLIKERNHVSMVELGRYINGFKGDKEWAFNGNMLVWNECSEEGIQALTELLNEERIIMNSDHKLVYIMDGQEIIKNQNYHKNSSAKKCVNMGF